jgi:hypothetical protein
MLRRFALSLFIVLTLGVGGMSPADAKEGSGGAKDPNAPHPEFEYVQLDPLTLPVITTRGLTQQVSLKVRLEVDWGKKEEIASFEPRLIDAYLQDLYGALSAGSMMKNNVVDIVQVKQRLTAVTDRVLGPEHKVREVLLEVLQQRPM